MDCIYIDPPYNTGARDWKYNNDYVDGADAYRHSKWLAMMERRLKLAKKLLNPADSVLICTIDEKEYLRLGLLLERLFAGERIQMITALTNRKGQARNGTFARCDEYIFFVFIGNASVTQGADTMLGDEEKTASSKQPTIWNSLLRRGTHSARWERPKLFFPIFVNETEERIVSVGTSLAPDEDRSTVVPSEGCVAVWPMHSDGSEGCWQLSPEKLRTYLKNGFARLGRRSKNGQWAINYLKRKQLNAVKDGTILTDGVDKNGALVLRYPEEVPENIQEPRTMWKKASFDASAYGSTLLKAVIPGRAFPFPKSLYAVEDTIRFFVANKPDALVLDFFSGSGTTAHAVMRLNHQDGGHRRCICITNNEVSDAEEKRLAKAGYRHGDPEWESLGICEYITKPRIEAAITGLTPKGEPIKGDYKFTDEFPMADGFEENAVFFDLTYEDPDAVEFGSSFGRIAPLLWLRAGAQGRIIERDDEPFTVADAYAVLFDFSHVREFVDAVKSTPDIACAYVVTDDTARYAGVREQLPGIDVVRLYESYLRSFRIAAEDAVR